MLEQIVSVNTLSAVAPGKLIISGEHAVLYQQPAIAIAINRYTTTTIKAQDLAEIQFNLFDLAYTRSFNIKELRARAIQAQNQYTEFLQGCRNIRTVLEQPFEMVQYAVVELLDYLQLPAVPGLIINVNSSIPIGCGLGSSSAALLSTIYALTNFLQCKLDPIVMFGFSQKLESLQHGKSSGVDLQLSANGGCVLFQNGVTFQRPIPKMPMYIVNTGQPHTTTGECVAHVALVFDTELQHQFGKITQNIDAAICNDDFDKFLQNIKANHSLLQQIGVVPPKVARFIAEVEKAGGAAKICGAGAIAGDNAGIILLVTKDDLSNLVAAHGYILENIEVDTHGTRII